MAKLPTLKYTELPRVCPRCEHKYMKYERTPQRKAKVLTFAGVLISLVWGVIWFAVLIPAIGISPFRLLIMFAGAAAPGVVIGIYAKSLRQLLSTKCRNCGLEEKFLFDKSYVPRDSK